MVLPAMPEPAGGLSTLGALFERMKPLEPDLTDAQKLDLLGSLVLELFERVETLEQIAGYGKVTK
jgi:hypothetical protein